MQTCCCTCGKCERTQQQVVELVSESFYTRTQVRQLVAELVRQHVASVNALLGITQLNFTNFLYMLPVAWSSSLAIAIR